jgi:hypothetical protein
LDRFNSDEGRQTMGFSESIAVKFLVKGETAVSVILKDQTNKFGVTIKNMAITAKIQELSLGDIQVQSTTFGNVDLKLLADLISKGTAIGLPYFNQFLDFFLPLNFPSTPLFGLFSLSDLNLRFFNNYVYAGVTPHFKMPKADSDWIPD